MFPRKSLFAFGFIAVAASVTAPGLAKATTYDLEYNCGNGSCTNMGVLGTVDITGGGGTLTYDFKTANPNILWNSGITTLLFDVTGTLSTESVTDATSGLTWTFQNPAANADGLSAGTWEGENCSGAHDCGTEAIVTLTGSNLAAAFNTINGLNFFAGADVNNNNGFTGMIGAVVPSAVPLPGAAMLFGSVLFGGLGMSRWRKRRARGPVSLIA